MILHSGSLPQRVWHVAIGLVVSLGLVAGACPLDHTNLYDPNTAVQFSISGPTSSSHGGDTLVYTATIDPRWTGNPPQWSSSDETVLRLVTAGHFVTVAEGHAEVLANLGPHQSHVDVTVAATLLSLRPCGGASDTLTYLGQSVPLCPVFTDSTGKPFPGTVTATLLADDPSVVMIANNAMVAVANGATWIHASARGLADSLLVTVKQSVYGIILEGPNRPAGGGGTVQLVYKPTDQGGAPVPGTTPLWSTDNPGVIDVSQTGLVTATGWGLATITAKAGSATGGILMRTTGGAAPAFQDASESYLGAQAYIIVRSDVLDLEGDASLLQVAGFLTIPLTHSKASQPADVLIGPGATPPSTTILATFDESENTTQITVTADTVTHSQAPQIMSVAAFRVGTDSLRVDFTARDDQMDAVEAWLVGPGLPVYVLPLFIRFSLPPSGTAQFSGSVGARQSVIGDSLGVLLRDATGAYSRVVMAPIVNQ